MDFIDNLLGIDPNYIVIGLIAFFFSLEQIMKSPFNFKNRINHLFQNLLFQIPNIPHSSVPSGQTEEDNEEVFREGAIPKLDENALPHWELVKKYDIIDFELGTKIISKKLNYKLINLG